MKLDLIEISCLPQEKEQRVQAGHGRSDGGSMGIDRV